MLVGKPARTNHWLIVAIFFRSAFSQWASADLIGAPRSSRGLEAKEKYALIRLDP